MTRRLLTCHLPVLAALGALASPCFASFSSVGSIITAQQKSSSASWSPTTSAQLSANNVGVLVIGVDNNDTSDGNTSLCTSVTDAASNTWVKAREFTNGQGAADGGATACIFYTKATTNLSSGSSITINLSVAKTAKAVAGWAFSMNSANVLSVESGADLANDGADAGSITLSSLANREHLFIRGGAVESNGTTYTASTNYTTFTHTSSTTSGGGGATNLGARGEFRILSGTSDSTDPTTSASDQASAYVAINEDAPPQGGGPRRSFISDNLIRERRSHLISRRTAE
jgi:hypothetical protein